VDNALDAAAAGSTAAERWVSLELVDDGEAVTISVSDSGPGVAGDVADRLFERGVSTKQDVPGGRGIGLSLVHLLCTRRGGAVEVQQDAATRFVARLPHTPVTVA
jgi:two-component system CitB family sensor kinase